MTTILTGAAKCIGLPLVVLSLLSIINTKKPAVKIVFF